MKAVTHVEELARTNWQTMAPASCLLQTSVYGSKPCYSTQSMPLSTSYCTVRPRGTAAVEDYIVKNGLANHPLNFTPQAYEPANKEKRKDPNASMQASCWATLTKQRSRTRNSWREHTGKQWRWRAGYCRYPSKARSRARARGPCPWVPLTAR